MHEAADSEIGLRAAAGNRLRVHANRSGRVSAPASNPQKTSTGAWHKRLYKFLEFIIATRSFDSINSVPPRFEHVRLETWPESSSLTSDTERRMICASLPGQCSRAACGSLTFSVHQGPTNATVGVRIPVGMQAQAVALSYRLVCSGLHLRAVAVANFENKTKVGSCLQL